MKKKILFIVDKPNWAYEFMVKSWVPFLTADYDCYIAYQQDYFIKRNNNNIIKRINRHKYKHDTEQCDQCIDHFILCTGFFPSFKHLYHS